MSNEIQINTAIAASAPIANDESARERMRQQQNLRPLTGEEEGMGIRDLPPGVFGFTYSPLTETPLFRRRSYHSFEVQKRTGGAVALIGYVSPEDAATLRTEGEAVSVTLYPENFGAATELVAIDTSRLAGSSFKPNRVDGHPLPVRVYPGSSMA